MAGRGAAVLAIAGATTLAVVMVGALTTLVRHPNGPFGWGATPLTYLLLLAIIALAHWRRVGEAVQLDA